MIRSNVAAGFLLLGGLIAPSVGIAQEPRGEKPPVGESPVQAEPVGTAAAPVPATVGNDPFFNYYSLYLPNQRSQAVARNFDALESNFGLSLSDADDALRAQLEIPTGQGVVVVGLRPGSLAEQAGLKTNDVFLSLGDQQVKSPGQVRTILMGLGKEALEVKLIREGKPRRMSLVGPEHGFPAEAAEYWIGTPVSPVDSTLRAHLPTLPADSGLIVNDVVKGSPADQVHLMKNDILISMGEKVLKNSDALIAQIHASQGKPVPLQVLRAGKPLTLAITPAKRAHPTVINLKKPTDAQFSYQVVQPHMAIEVQPGSRAPRALQALLPIPATPPPLNPGNITLYAPYSGILVDPFAGWDLITSNPASNPSTGPAIAQNWALPFPTAGPEPATARIEGQLKEVVAKLDEIAKALEALKKTAGK